MSDLLNDEEYVWIYKPDGTTEKVKGKIYTDKELTKELIDKWNDLDNDSWSHIKDDRGV